MLGIAFIGATGLWLTAPEAVPTRRLQGCCLSFSKLRVSSHPISSASGTVLTNLCSTNRILLKLYREMNKKYPSIPADVFTAVCTGDIKRPESLYKPGVDLERIARHSAKAKRLEVLEWYYSQGWIHPSKDSLNDRFYLAAICNGTPELFQVLLNHGFDINSHYTEHLGDALACAVIFDHHDFAKWLLDHGHRVNPHEPIYGKAPLPQPSVEMWPR